MAALSRNTASVAQDFHNAGGGVKTFVSNHSAEDNYKKIIMKHIKTEASKDVPWRQEYEQQQQLQHQQLQQFAPSAATFKNVSPPAPNLSHQHQPITATTMSPTNYNNNINRKRRKVSHEKENENIFFEEKHQHPQSPTTSPPSSTQTPLPVLASQLLNTNLKTHFDNYIRAQFYNPKKHLNLQAIIGDAVDVKDNNNRQSFKLPNHPELELSVSNVKVEQNVATDLRVGIPADGRGITVAEQNERVLAAEKRGRKQAQPRKVVEELEDIPSIHLLPTAAIPTFPLTTNNSGDSRENQLRDKHLDRLVSKKLRCTICRNRNQCMIMPYHTKASLMLHKMWRHTARNLRCKLCPFRCCKSYKMELHRRQRHLGGQRR